MNAIAKPLLIASVFLLASCASWEQTRPAANDVRVHYVADSQGICNGIVGHWDIYLGCAWWNKTLSSCDVFLPDGAPRFVLDHEMKHCQGYDH